MRKPYDPVKHREQWQRTLERNPFCSRCHKNPHGKNTIWCRECIRADQKEKRKADGGAWYKKLTEEQKEKRRRRAAVWRLIWAGKLIPKPCEVCGCLKTEADHHKGYDRKDTYEIRWLCHEHHIALEAWRRKKLTERRQGVEIG